MARRMTAASDKPAFRVFTVTEGVNGDGKAYRHEHAYGPYATKAAAKGQETQLHREHAYRLERWASWREPLNETFVSKIQTTTSEWKDVD